MGTHWTPSSKTLRDREAPGRSLKRGTGNAPEGRGTKSRDPGLLGHKVRSTSAHAIRRTTSYRWTQTPHKETETRNSGKRSGFCLNSDEILSSHATWGKPFTLTSRSGYLVYALKKCTDHICVQTCARCWEHSELTAQCTGRCMLRGNRLLREHKLGHC